MRRDSGGKRRRRRNFRRVCGLRVDLNNLRTINNSLGHDKGDEYIRSFAVQLRKAVPEEYFVGRNGGDEFLAILRGLNREEVKRA